MTQSSETPPVVTGYAGEGGLRDTPNSPSPHPPIEAIERLKEGPESQDIITALWSALDGVEAYLMDRRDNDEGRGGGSTEWERAHYSLADRTIRVLNGYRQGISRDAQQIMNSRWADAARSREALSQAQDRIRELEGEGWSSETPPELPGNYIDVRSTEITTYRWWPYKPDGARQMGKKGRWQRARGEYGGWENAVPPKGAQWRPNLPISTPKGKGEA